MRAADRFTTILALLFAVLFTSISTYGTERITHKYRDLKINADSTFTDSFTAVKSINAFINFCPVKMPASRDSIEFSIYGQEDKGYKLRFRWRENKLAAFDENSIYLTLSIINIENDSTIITRQISDSKIVNFNKVSNQLSIFGNKFDGIDFYLNKKYHLGKIAWKNDINAISAESSADLNIKKYTLRAITDNSKELITGYNFEKIQEIIRLNANDSIAGIYKYLDKYDDDKYAVVGGKYVVALLPDNAGNYSVIYISGATAYGSIWETGYIKGMLKKTVFSNNYDLIWYDSRMELIDDECSATITDNNIIEFNFPLLKSQIRFVKIDKL